MRPRRRYGPAGRCAPARRYGPTGRAPGYGGQIQPPVMGPHRAPLRILELALPHELESRLPADGVGRGVMHRRKRVQRAVEPLGPRSPDDLPCGRHRDAPALELGQHAPARLVRRRALPGQLPEPDRPHHGARRSTRLPFVIPRRTVRQQYDPEHLPRPVQVEISPVPREQLPLRLRAAQMPGHLRCVEPAQQIETVRAPRLDPHPRWRPYLGPRPRPPLHPRPRLRLRLCPCRCLCLCLRLPLRLHLRLHPAPVSPCPHSKGGH